MCLVKINNKVLLVEYCFLGKLDFFGGGLFEYELVVCIVYREMWEEIGFNVEVI